MKLKIFLLLLLSNFAAHSQITVLLHVNDFQKKPLSFAIVNYQGRIINSNTSGFFSISNYELGSEIKIHSFGFADTTIATTKLSSDSDTINLSVTLRFKLNILPEVSISSAITEEINPMKADFLIDYELKDYYLLELLSDDIVIVLDLDNKIVSRSKPIKSAKEIAKDPYGNIHVLSDKGAHRIDLNGPNILIDRTPVDPVKFKWNQIYCAEAKDTSVYIRRYKDNNQTTAFFAISTRNNEHVKLLKEITDHDRKNAVAAYANEANALNQYLASRDISIVTASTSEELLLANTAHTMIATLEMNYVSPYYSFLKSVNDSIYLFAHDLDSMYVYDKNWQLIKSKRIEYHHLKIWGQQLYVNEEHTKVYAKLIANSRIQLAEIDLQTGALKPTSTQIDSPFPTKIRIRKNIIYYLAKQKSGTGYTVYSQKL